MLKSGRAKGELNKRTKTSAKIADKIKEARNNLVVPSNYHVVTSAKDLGRIARLISSEREFAFDTETSGLKPWRDKLYCVSIYVGGQAFLINFEHPLLPRISKSLFTSELRQYFEGDYKRIGFNYAFDSHFLEHQAGIVCGPAYWDGFLGIWLTNEEQQPKALKPVCEEWLGIKGDKYQEQFGKTAWTVIDPQLAFVYACKDAELHYQLYEYETSAIIGTPVYRLAHQLEMPCFNEDLLVEREGFDLDVRYLQDDLAVKMEAQLAEIRLAMYDAAKGVADARDRYNDEDVYTSVYGRDILELVNINSDDELPDYLFGTLGLPRFEGNSTRKEVLEKLVDRHPFVGLLIDYRNVYKLKTAFVDSLPELLWNDGKLHPSILTIGSKTGRTSMKDPNLLQMPAKVGDLIRKAFLAPPGFVWVSKDFQGQELRIQAATANERRLVKLLEEDGDVYADTAAFFFKVPYAELAHAKGDKRRDKGKRGVLALSYGAMAGKIAEIFGCSFQEAKKFLNDFYTKLYPGLGKYQATQKKKAKDKGYVETILGRRRHLDLSKATSSGMLAALERQAINSPIQGSAADQAKLAFVLCARHFRARGYRSRVKLRVHDELVFWIHEDELFKTTILQEIDHIMTECIQFGIKMATTTEIYTEKWGEKRVIDGSDRPAD